MKLIYTFIAFAISAIGFAQGNESFTNIGTSSTSYANNTWSGDNGETWTASDSRRDQTITDKAITIRTGNLIGNLTTAQAANGIGNLTFDYKIPYSDTTKNITATITAGGISYPYNIGLISSTNTVYSSMVIPLNVQTAESIEIEISSLATGARLTIDNLTWTAYQVISTPNISVTPESLTGLNYTFDQGPSTSQSFSVSGTNLNNSDVIITAPTNFEVSTDNVTFTQTATLTAFNGTAANIYVRLTSGLVVNTYTGDVTIAGGGSTATLNVSVSGEVSAAAALTITPESLTGLNYTFDQGPSTSQSFAVSGTNLNNSDVVITAPTNFEVSTDNITFTQTATLTAFNGTAANVHVRLASGLAIDTYTGTITITGGSTTTLNVSVSGEVSAAASLTITPESLTGLNYIFDQGPSTSQSFAVSGTNLNNSDVIITAPTNFEVSTDNVTFTQTASLTAFNGTAANVHVRLASGLAIDTYTGTTTITGGGSTTTLNVSVSGEVSNNLSTEKNNIEGLKVYPNPASDLVNIVSNEIGTKNVAIYDMLGKKVLETTTQETMNVSDLNSGVYIINITQDGKSASRKLVIK